MSCKSLLTCMQSQRLSQNYKLISKLQTNDSGVCFPQKRAQEVKAKEVASSLTQPLCASGWA